MKSMNPIQKDPHMTELHICIFVFYKYICYDIVIFNEFSNFVWNMFNAKTIKVHYIFIIHMQSYPMSSYLLIIIKIF